MERWFLPNGHVKHFKGGCGKYLKLTRETENTKLQRFYKKRRNYPCERERLQNKIVSGHAHIKCKIVDEQVGFVVSVAAFSMY